MDCFKDISCLPVIIETTVAMMMTFCSGLFMSRHQSILNACQNKILRCREELPPVAVVKKKPKDDIIEFVPEWESPFVRLLLKHIDDRISDSTLTVAELAMLAGISRQQLFRKTKQLVGVSPNHLIRTRRLEYARHLMIAGRHSVSEVCYMSGFSTPSYFSRCFRKQFGCLPSNMRDGL